MSPQTASHATTSQNPPKGLGLLLAAMFFPGMHPSSASEAPYYFRGASPDTFGEVPYYFRWKDTLRAGVPVACFVGGVGGPCAEGVLPPGSVVGCEVLSMLTILEVSKRSVMVVVLIPPGFSSIAAISLSALA